VPCTSAATGASWAIPLPAAASAAAGLGGIADVEGGETSAGGKSEQAAAPAPHSDDPFDLSAAVPASAHPSGGDGAHPTSASHRFATADEKDLLQAPRPLNLVESVQVLLSVPASALADVHLGNVLPSQVLPANVLSMQKNTEELVGALFDGPDVLASTACQREAFSDGSLAMKDIKYELPAWSGLRVSFLDTEIAKAPVSVPASADSKKNQSSMGLDTLDFTAPFSNATGSSSSSQSSHSHSTSDFQDELVALTCEFAASLRAEGVLAESLWADAIALGKDRLIQLKGEDFSSEVGAQQPAMPIAQPKPKAALVTPHVPVKVEDIFDVLVTPDEEAPAADSGDPVGLMQPDAFLSAPLMADSVATSPEPGVPLSTVHTTLTAAKDSANGKLVVHNECLRLLQLAFEQTGEKTLFSAAAPYEAQARLDENHANLIAKAVQWGFQQMKVTPLPFDQPPSLLSLSLSEYRRFPAEDGDGVRGNASPAQKLCVTEEGASSEMEFALVSVYRLAYFMTRVFVRSLQAQVHLLEARSDDEMRCRLLRKKKHVQLRCGSAFFNVASLISQLQENYRTVNPVMVPKTVSVRVARMMYFCRTK
jgi:hypothetical protein